MVGVAERHQSISQEMDGPHQRFSKHEEALEVKSLRRIISAYINYSDAAEDDVRRYERSFKKLSPEHKALLSHLPLKYQRLRRCISVNSFFIMNMLQAFDPPFDMSQDIDVDGHGDFEDQPDSHLFTKASHFNKGSCNYSEQPAPESRSSVSSCNGGCENALISSKRNNEKQISSLPTNWMETSLRLSVPLVDVDKVRCIIRNIVRDWALEGQKERDKCYKPILEELNHLFPIRSKERPPCCLVPGAGLGRLALEISSLGFVSQGNEFSYYMMICSSFILNQTEVANQWRIYPWIHSNSNSLSDDHQLRPVSFPDILPASVMVPKAQCDEQRFFCFGAQSAGITEGFSMCGGDFVEVYNDIDQEASWDAVVTCFFIDTAHNIVEYIEVISKILKVGGVWINLGPLLYHFADSYGPEEEMSVEISLEDLKKISLQYGFELEMEKMVETTYTANPLSMMQNHYYTAFWTMKKKPKA